MERADRADDADRAKEAKRAVMNVNQLVVPTEAQMAAAMGCSPEQFAAIAAAVTNKKGNLPDPCPE